jgi:hypothetical protein
MPGDIILVKPGENPVDSIIRLEAVMLMKA